MKYSYVLILIAVTCMLQAASATPEMNIEPAEQSVTNGSVFTVNITVYPLGSEITAAAYILSFDTELLNAVSQTQGDFLRQDGAPTYKYKDKIDNTAGTVEYAEYQTAIPDEDTYGVFDPGVLASVTFEVTGDNTAGNLNISCPVVGIVDRSEDPSGVIISIDAIPGNATFTIGGSYPKGDLNHNWVAADLDDVMLMLRASVGDVTTNPEYDLNGNGAEADAGDVTRMLRASVGEITL